PSLREGWVIVRRDPKTIGSPFGEVRYERTLFRNKKRKVHAYLADRLVGYKPHQRLDSLLEADLLEEAVDKSYAKAARSLENVSLGLYSKRPEWTQPENLDALFIGISEIVDNSNQRSCRHNQWATCRIK